MEREKKMRGESNFMYKCQLDAIMAWDGRLENGGKGMRACKNTSNLWLDFWA